MLLAGIALAILALLNIRGSNVAYYVGVGLLGLSYLLSCVSIYQHFLSEGFGVSAFVRVVFLGICLSPIVTGDLRLQATIASAK